MEKLLCVDCWNCFRERTEKKRCEKLSEFIRKYIYEKTSHFKYSSRIICSLFVVICCTYQVSRSTETVTEKKAQTGRQTKKQRRSRQYDWEAQIEAVRWRERDKHKEIKKDRNRQKDKKQRKEQTKRLKDRQTYTVTEKERQRQRETKWELWEGAVEDR